MAVAAAVTIALGMGLLAFGDLARDWWAGLSDSSDSPQAQDWVQAIESHPGVQAATAELSVGGEPWDLLSIAYETDADVTSDELLDVLQSIADATDPQQASAEQLVLVTRVGGSVLREDMTPFVAPEKLDYGVIVMAPGAFDLASYRPDPVDAALPALEDSMVAGSAAETVRATRWDLGADAYTTLTVWPQLQEGTPDQVDSVLRVTLAEAAQFALDHGEGMVTVALSMLPPDVDVAGLESVTTAQALGATLTEEGLRSVTVEGADVLGAVAATAP